MANNVEADSGAGGATFKTTDNAGVHTPHTNVDASALPTGAATAAKQPALGTAGTASTDVLTVQGIAAMTPLLVNASGTAVPVTDNAGSLTVDNAGTFAVQVSSIAAGTNNIGDVDVLSSALPTGASTAAKQPALGTAGTASADVITVQGIAAMTPLLVDASGAAVPITDNAGSLTVDGTVTANAGTNLNTSALALEAGGNLAAAATSLAAIDDWDESDRAKVNPIVGQAGVQGGAGTITALTQRVVLASDQTALTVPLSTKEQRPATATVTTVADTASSTTLLASTATRLGASIQNDSSAVCYVKFGTTASATDYTVRLVQYAYYEVPFGYTGRIDAIWASDPGDGAARITELTA